MGFYNAQVLPRFVDTIRNYSLKGPKPWSDMYVGRARNP
jgi:hypothetical protein